MHYYALNHLAVYEVIHISSTFTGCNISDAYILMHHKLSSGTIYIILKTAILINDCFYFWYFKYFYTVVLLLLLK